MDKETKIRLSYVDVGRDGVYCMAYDMVGGRKFGRDNVAFNWCAAVWNRRG